MDDLPELPFEKVLSYLSLEDRLKARAVSRRWYNLINIFKVKTLCYSDRPAGFILGKRRLVSGSFAQNFICSTQFESFFNTFGPTILSNLKHLRICDLRVSPEKLPAFFSTLQSFGQLEELDIIRFNFHLSSSWSKKFELTLPVLTSIRLEKVRGFNKLTLDAPQLLKIKTSESYHLSLELVHAESVEWFMTSSWTAIAVKGMKNLKYFYLDEFFDVIDPTFLSSFEQLKEIHLRIEHDLEELFEQKHRHSRTDLKIYLCGLLLNGPDDPAIRSLLGPVEKALRCLAENPSRLADRIPFWDYLRYTVIERVSAGTEMSVWKRFTDLKEINVRSPIEDTERFLNLLKNLHNIERLEFKCGQPQDLFDRLPEHCSAVQNLTICSTPSDYRFLFRLQHLMHLFIVYISIDAEAIRTIIEKNEFLSLFIFKYLDKVVRIEIEYPKQFNVTVDRGRREVPDLDAAIELIIRDSKKTKG